MYQFFVDGEQISKDIVRIEGSDVKYIKDIIRLRIGEKIRVSAAAQNYFCRIEEIASSFVCARILEKDIEGTELKNRIVLFQGLPKGDKMELVIQKAVELGASEIVPVRMKHCVVRLDEKKAAAKTARWQMIAENAARQSKRSMIPKVVYPMAYREAVSYARSLDQCLVPYENENGMRGTKEAFAHIRTGDSVGILIGPEGGFAPEEIALAKEDMQPVSLGKRILRTETAGLAALSILMYHLELKQEEADADAGISGQFGDHPLQ